jgi:hypothetical protein
MIADTVQRKHGMDGAAGRAARRAPVRGPRASCDRPRRTGPGEKTVSAYGATCPSCGGALLIHDGERSIRCGYCDSALLVTTPRGTRSFLLRPKVSEGKARLAAIHHIEDRTDRRVSPRNASIIDMKLMHVPFWRMRGRLMGWVSGDRVTLERVETASDDPGLTAANTAVREARVPYARLVFKRVDWSTPACILPSLGLQGISLRTDFLAWELFDQKRSAEHAVALPMRSERETRNDALSYLTRLVIPAGSKVRASRFHLFDSSFSLYYYPVYFLRYGHAGRVYSVTIDGASGAVLRGEVPARRRLDARGLFFIPAALAFLALAYPPLALIGAGVLYAYDCLDARALLPPHRWLAARLEGALGGEG